MAEYNIRVVCTVRLNRRTRAKYTVLFGGYLHTYVYRNVRRVFIETRVYTHIRNYSTESTQKPIISPNGRAPLLIYNVETQISEIYSDMDN